jgi:hypothetical protein
MITNNIEAFNVASNRGLIGTYQNIKVDANGNVFINCQAPETDAEIFDVVINGNLVIHSQPETIIAEPIVEETPTEEPTKTKQKDGTK